MAVALFHKEVFPLQQIGEPRPQGVPMPEIPQAQGLFHVFVGVHGRDAPAGGAELLVPQAILLQDVQQLVIGHADGGPVAEQQMAGLHGDAALAQALHLTIQVLQVDDDARAQDVDGLVPQDAGGHQVHDELALFVDHGVAGVVAALITHHDIVAGGQQVHHAALALVAPVGSHDC